MEYYHIIDISPVCSIVFNDSARIFVSTQLKTPCTWNGPLYSRDYNIRKGEEIYSDKTFDKAFYHCAPDVSSTPHFST